MSAAEPTEHRRLGIEALIGRGELDFTRERLEWLVTLRWGAMAGTGVGALIASTGLITGVEWRLIALAASLGAAYNWTLWRALRSGKAATGGGAALGQAVFDVALLTVVLWAAGGLDCPFRSFYVFHVALIAILGGPRGTAAAVTAAGAGAGFLALTHFFPSLSIAEWNPSQAVAWMAEVAAFAATVAGTAYIVLHAARQLRAREQALAEARDQAELEYQLLSNTLDEMEAGLEVVEADGTVLWRNKRAEELAPWATTGELWECPGEKRPCERDVGHCPMERAREDESAGRCRFSATLGDDEDERVYEMLAFPIEGRGPEPRVMNLYVDRTRATLAEAKLLLAERLASLGRVAQGVAHELNTPLATIRTLATDMRSVLVEIDSDEARDVLESATLIRDETRRLGRITQALLAGGDLVRIRPAGEVSLSAAVERARAIVTAGMRGEGVEIDDGVDRIRTTVDVDRLVQVLVNLLQNALDASRESDEPVRLFAEASDTGIRIVVTDDGPGISPEVASRLFEPFATTKPPGEGTGLGLYTSYMLVQEMGGELTLRSAEPRGAIACVEIPGGAEENTVPTHTRDSERAPASRALLQSDVRVVAHAPKEGTP